MSKLEELIQELCPNGVEYKELGDVVTFLNGRAYKQNELLDSGKYKVLRVGNFYTNNQWYYSNLELDDNKYCQKGDLLYTWAATIGPQIWNGEKVIYHYHIWKLIYDDSILNKHYLFHYLKKDINDISNSLTNSTMPHVSMSSMKKRIIPIPPMEVQQEIVRLLDEFTAKTAELQAELNKEYEARKKQYEYYRETVLNDNLDSMTVKIGDVADLKAGATPKTSNPEFWENGTIPWMSSGEVNQGKVTYTEKKITELGYNSSSTKMLPSETVVIALAGQGKTRGTVAITQIPLCTNQSLCGICAKDELNSMYLYHYLKSRYEDLRAISNGDGTRGGLNLKMIANYDIPLPPLEVQMKIVNILDKLDSINNDMYSSINNEIESRQKQYEFYRDKLLTFKELK